MYIPIEHIPFGSLRRQLILKHFNNDPTLKYAVNCRYRPQLKRDPDLRKLLKQGKLIRVREANRTYLKLTP